MQQSESSNPQKSMPYTVSIENVSIDELRTWVSNAADGSREYQKRIYELLASRIYRVIRKIVGASNANHQIRAEDAEVLQLAMEQISGEQRAILHMKEVEGLGYEAIASVLGIPEGTVGSRLNKARKELRTSLIQLGWESQ